MASFVENPNIPDQFGYTPVFWAASFGHTEIVKFLASVVENPNSASLNGVTPLDVATQENHTEIVEFLTQHESIRRNQTFCIIL